MLRRLIAPVLAVCALSLATSARAASMFDPALGWKTIVTPHFRVNYPDGCDAEAQKTAQYAEETHALLSPYFHEVPARRTELTLLDNEDTVNGFGFPLPNNMIYAYLQSPAEDELEGRYDAWLRDIIIHEYTHVLHLEKTSGLPAWINKVFGRSLFPNMFMPVFMIEGLAVTDETIYTHGGRGRDATYRAILRMAALEGKLTSMDKASGYYVVDYPAGDLPYVYGMAFYRYIRQHYGPDAPARIVEDYAKYPFFNFYGLDQSLYKVTGKSAQELWDAMCADLRVRALTEEIGIRAQGPLTKTTPVTHGGQYHRHPEWGPDGTLYWAEWTGHTFPALMAKAPGKPARRVITKGPLGHWAISRDGRSIFHTRDWDTSRFTAYTDVFRWDLQDKKIHQLTHRARMSDPEPSPDGQWVVAVQSGHAQTNLVRMRADGKDFKVLTHFNDQTQISAPAWHPSRNLVAVSAWKDGARDLYLVDPDTGAMQPLWRDREVDINPTWSPDGRYLLFSSDRTGVYNLYAYELYARKLYRITNVLGGLEEPAVAPDGKTIAAVSYDTGGFDVVTLPYDPKTWVSVPLPADEDVHQPSPQLPAGMQAPFPVERYNPWPSLSPKTWAPVGFFDERGPVIGFETLGEDSLLKHYLFGEVGYGLMSSRPTYAFGYQNDVLYPSFYAYAADTSLVTSPFYQGVTYNIPQRGLYQGLTVSFPGLPSYFLQNSWVTGDQLSFGLSLANVQNLLATPASLPAAKAPPVGQTNSLSLQYTYGDNYRHAYSISPEGGSLVTLGYMRGMPLLGSQYQFDRVWADYRRYFALPWQHHVLAVRAMGGFSDGSQAGQFYLGGFDSATYLTTVDLRTASSVSQAQLPLRGYPIGASSGPKGYALSAEYRFPIVNVQRGYGTYPIFVRMLHGALFAETGQTWSGPFSWHGELATAGLELRAQTYFLEAPSELRLGIGQGLVAQEGVLPWPAVYADIGSYF